MGKVLALATFILGLIAVACGGAASPTVGIATPAREASPTATSTATPTTASMPTATAVSVTAPMPTATDVPATAPTPTAAATPTSIPEPLPTSTQAAPGSLTVNAVIVNFTHVDLTVPAGSTVVWTNNDTVQHTTTARNGDWDSDWLEEGRSFSLTFTEPGAFNYLCTIHPSMTATVTVTPAEPVAAAPTPTLEPTPMVVTIEAAIQVFAHQDLNVMAGTTVVWTNRDGARHTTTAEEGQWDSSTLQEGQSFSFTFTEAGVFSYFCAIHTYMTAEVTVNN